MRFAEHFLSRCWKVVEQINKDDIEAVVHGLIALRDRGGRLFLLGNGGGAAHASHAASDFRKMGEIECYCPSDNAVELTARANDEGWNTAYMAWLRGSRLCVDDAVLVISVGGGDLRKNISANISEAIYYAKSIPCAIYGIVGRDGGDTKKIATACIWIPTMGDSLVTPIVEGLQSLLLHLIVSHPDLQKKQAKWESVQ